MRTVRMKYGISGGRGDGTDWPAADGQITVSDEEAVGLIAGGLAEWMPELDPRPVPVPDIPDPTVKPIVNSPKSAWVAHAVAQGADRAEAEAMKKTDLIARYGNG